MHIKKLILNSINLLLISVFSFGCFGKLFQVFAGPEYLIANNFFFPLNCPGYLISLLRCTIPFLMAMELIALGFFVISKKYKDVQLQVNGLQLASFIFSMNLLFNIIVKVNESLLLPYIWMDTLGLGFSWMQHFVFNLFLLVISRIGLRLHYDLQWEKFVGIVTRNNSQI